jgi:rRNA maturation RNase YbeY
MRCLNKKFLNIDGTTDVLAFGIPDCRGLLHADIAVCIDEAQRNARAYATSLKYELELYALHGLLHILGYKDKTLKQRKTMQSKAEKILTLK